MKLLRNPVVVAILAVVAVAMVIYQVVGPKAIRALFGQTPPASSAVAPNSIPVAKVSPSAPVPAPAPVVATPAPRQALRAPAVRAVTYTNLDAALLPAKGVDVAMVGPGFNAWVRAPLRDPFLLLAPVVRDAGFLAKETNSPVPSWKLKAVWNQTGSRLAVINDRVCRVGDIIEEGYKLIRIENDEVWFQGPYRNERLGFPPPKQGPPLGKK